MTQRTAIVILGALSLALLAYLVATTYLNGAKPAGEWENATESYVQEYHRWLSTSPASGWARVQALAAGPEWDRIEKLKAVWEQPTDWQYASGTYVFLGQLGETALVHAQYILQRGIESKEVEETYLLRNGIGGIKVVQLVALGCGR